MERVKYDAIVIGSGQGGNPLAQALAGRGEKVALIESNYLGGTCINTGCTPTKTMVASAQVAHYAREGARWGVHASDVRVDLSAIVRRKHEVVMRFRSGWESSVDQEGKPKLHRGRARFTGPREIQVGDVLRNAEKIFIDTGSAPSIPSIDGLLTVPYLTNETLLEQTQLPQHLVVLGGGYVGLEFAQMFRRFGSEVTVIQSAERILPNEDEDITAALQKCLESEGIQFLLHARATKVRTDGDQVVVTVLNGETELNISGSHLLVAAGRTPQTKDLDLEKAGVEVTEKGTV